MFEQLLLLVALGPLYSQVLGKALTPESSKELCGQLSSTFASSLIFPNNTQYSALSTENWYVY